MGLLLILLLILPLFRGCHFGGGRGRRMPADLNLRIALHAGPVYEFNDPVTGSRSYSGTHVSRAARIEPVTPPGQVYASKAFAALAAARGVTDFACD
jgi:class 3 adenylate cyclase